MEKCTLLETGHTAELSNKDEYGPDELCLIISIVLFVLIPRNDDDVCSFLSRAKLETIQPSKDILVLGARNMHSGKNTPPPSIYTEREISRISKISFF